LNRNGGASPDAREEVTAMETGTEAPIGERPTAAKPAEATRVEARVEPKRHGRGGRRARRRSSDGVRYFVGQPAAGDGKPTLEQEVASEPEALVIAFKNDSRVYLVNEFRVTQRIERGQVRLEKEQAAAAQTVSTTNAS
jgi:hypothetical protein